MQIRYTVRCAFGSYLSIYADLAQLARARYLSVYSPKW